MEKVKILFFSADPNSAPPHGRNRRLLLDEEVREIHEKVRKARYRDDLDLDTRWATRAGDLLPALNEASPQVVHFSGHGGDGGLVLVGSDPSRAHAVDAAQLARLFEVFRGDIRLVVLNACFSLPQAEAVAAVVGCAIGTRTGISDAAAIIFSSWFYWAIASGCSVGAAFEQARMELEWDLEHREERDCLQLVSGPGVDPAELYLIPQGGSGAGERQTGEGQVGDTDAGRRSTKGPRRAWITAGGLALVGMVAVALQLSERPPTAGTALCDSAGAPHALMAPAGFSTAGASGVRSDLDRAKVDYEAGRYAAALPRFRRFAQSGNPEAMGYLGIMFLRGRGTRAEPDSGIYWLRKAAYKRDPEAMTELASAYQYGDGVDRSPGLAREWYHKAADKGSAEAMRRLGTLHRDEKDHATALTWFQNAVKAGSLEARIDAGELYEQGRGTPQDLKAAFCLYRTAAEAGSPRGMLTMGRIYQDGIGVPRRDYDRAAEWYRKAAAKGSPEGMRALGELYLDGLGVPRDTARAELWFGRARDAGRRIADAGPVAPGAD
ncbi:MAG TPA: CHAT domain-containing protein [Longimicrobium sp.]|jgi:TPR repeat protein